MYIAIVGIFLNKKKVFEFDKNVMKKWGKSAVLE